MQENFGLYTCVRGDRGVFINFRVNVPPNMVSHFTVSVTNPDDQTLIHFTKDIQI